MVMVWSHRRRIGKRKQSERMTRVKPMFVALGLRMKENEFVFAFWVTTKLVK